MTDEIEDCRLMLFRQHSPAQRFDLPLVTQRVAMFVCSQDETKGATWFVGWTRTEYATARTVTDRDGVVAALIRRAKTEA